MQQLKDAERKATQLVTDARKARVDRMRDAKTEAEQLIAAYRSEMEKTYQSKLSAVICDFFFVYIRIVVRLSYNVLLFSKTESVDPPASN